MFHCAELLCHIEGRTKIDKLLEEGVEKWDDSKRGRLAKRWEKIA
jgi:hypothetical protein